MKFPMQSSSFQRDLVKDLCGLMQKEDGQGTRSRSSDKQRNAQKKGTSSPSPPWTSLVRLYPLAKPSDQVSPQFLNPRGVRSAKPKTKFRKRLLLFATRGWDRLNQRRGFATVFLIFTTSGWEWLNQGRRSPLWSTLLAGLRNSHQFTPNLPKIRSTY
jgi:hypothetical protein